MRYEESLIDQVQTANDIVEVITQYVPLKRAGRNFKACCPFHQEKTGSFMVHPEKQIFHCFGCGVGGNVFSFLMRYENASFPEVLRQLAERAHIRLPEPTARKTEGPSQSEQLYEVYRLACDYYHTQLFGKDAKAARDYFKSRGFDRALAEELKVGWAPEEWQGLFTFLSKKGYSNELLLRSGLIHRSSKGNLYDAFRGRLLFPIFNLQGKPVAFGGRLIGEGEGPKYLNSPENPIFQKRRELFGLNLAKRFIDRERPRLLVVEGYFDFLRLYQKGFKFSVATLGTALTEHHVQVLKRFAEEAVVIYDGDKAGEAAALRGLEVFLQGGMSVKLIRLPQGYDPDDFLAKHEPAEFGKLLERAQDFFDFKLEILLGRYNRSDSLGLMKITGDFLETFTKIDNPILLDRYLKRLAGSLGIEENSLRSELAKLKKRTSGQAASPHREVPAPPEGAGQLNEEVILLGLMIEEAECREEAFQSLKEDDFQADWARELFGVLLRLSEAGKPYSWPEVFNRLHKEEPKARLSAVLTLEWGREERFRAFQDCLAALGRRKLDTRLLELRRLISRAEKEGRPEAIAAYLKEYQSLMRVKSGPDSRSAAVSKS